MAENSDRAVNDLQIVEDLLELNVKLRSFADAKTELDLVGEIEVLLDEITSFLYYRYYVKDEEGYLGIVSELGPDDLQMSEDLYEWSMAHNSPSLIPERSDVDDEIKASILIPFKSVEKEFGVICLWVDFDESGFTQHKLLSLQLVAQEAVRAMVDNAMAGEIKKQKNFMENIIASVPHGLIATGLDGSIVNINSDAEILFNVNKNKVLNQKMSDVLPDEVSNSFRSLMNNIQKAVGVSETEIEYDLSSTNKIYLGIQVSLIKTDDGEEIGFVFICRDLALSREIVKLRELDAMKNDFVSLVSHELRTPLSSIISYSEVLLTPGMVETKEENDEFLNIILEEGQRLARLINDILDLSKAESGKMEYIFDEFDVNSIASQCVRNSKSLSDKKDIELKEELAEDLPKVQCDMDRVIQVFLNVLSNGIKFTDEGGLIIISSRVAEEDQKKFVEIEIKDNGMGIPASSIDRVFNKFEQVESVDHHSVGTGLGMPICKQIIEQGHGGEMFLTSEVGVGTSVFFRLPI